MNISSELTNNTLCSITAASRQLIEKWRKYIDMKATGIVRRIDDLGRVVIPKEIRRTMRIREGDPLQKSLTLEYRFCSAMQEIAERLHIPEKKD